MAELDTKGFKPKEKNYEYNEKARKIKLQPTRFSPLQILITGKSDAFRIKDQKVSSLKVGSLKDPLNKKREGMIDPLSSKAKQGLDPLNRPASSKLQPSDPLSNNARKDPLSSASGAKKEDVKNPLEKKNPMEIKNSVGGISSLSVKVKTLDFKEEKKVETSEWTEIRLEFVKIFDMKNQNMDSLLQNPFSTMSAADDKTIKVTRQGEHRVDFDEFALKKKTENLVSKKNFLKNIEMKHKEMKDHWENGDKVATLQVSIQSCKLLVDNDQPKFYPLKFVYVTDIIEDFGNLVFQRMKRLAFPHLPEEKLKEITDSSIAGKNISESAQEIGRNWLVKISSIRELLPRMYMEVSLLKLYYFIDANKIKVIAEKLAAMSRCLGDYVLSAYFSTYLMRMAAETIPKEKEFILRLFEDFLFYMKQGGRFSAKMMSDEEYLGLFEPFFKTLFRLYSQNASNLDFINLLATFQNSNQHSEILKKIIMYFAPLHVSIAALEIYKNMQSYPIEIRNDLNTEFLKKLSYSIPSKQVCESLCRNMWKDISQVKSFSDFLNMVANLIDLIYKSFKGYEKNEFFHEMLQKFNVFFLQIDSTGKNLDIFLKLEEFLKKIIRNCEDISEILSLEPFLQFVTYFPANLKASVCKNILTLFVEKEKGDKIDDPISVHALLAIAKNMNENYTRAVPIDERLAMTNLITRFLLKVDFGKDLEQSLNLYTEVRAHFGNIPEIVEFLINNALSLTSKARTFSKGKYTKKIVGFLQACIAYCFITIPTIEDPYLQLKLFLNTAQVALTHNMISQAESLFKAGISIMSELPENLNDKPLDVTIETLLKQYIDFLIVLPENPENDALHVLNGFYNGIKVFKWNNKSGVIYKVQVLIDFMVYLSIQLQEKLPFHVVNVRSNDALYADADFKNKVFEMMEIIGSDITEIQKDLDFSVLDINISVKQIQICFNSINTLISFFRPCVPVNTMITNFLKIGRKKISELYRDRIAVSKLSPLIKSTCLNIRKNYQAKELMEMSESLLTDYGLIKPTDAEKS